MSPGFDPSKPYNDLPPLPPAREVETRPVWKACTNARASLAELKAAGGLIPDESVLINIIPILEAKDSSEIENIVTTNDALFRQASLMEAEAEPQTKEALRYRGALYYGFRSLSDRPLTARTALEICRKIKEVDLDVRATPGTALRNRATGEVIYTPPENPERLRAMLANWESFLNEPSDLDPLVRMAIQHYQFEAIHPFPDGNGRTGRILNILTLIQYGLLDQPTLYLSRHILRTRMDYYRLLNDVTTRGDWEAWLVYMLTAVDETARWTNAKIKAIRALMLDTSEYIRNTTPKIYSRDLIDVLFTQPYCKISHLVERGIAKRETASSYLKQLDSIGVVKKEKAGRDILFIHRKYLDLLGSDAHEFSRYPAMAAGPAPKKKLK